MARYKITIHTDAYKPMRCSEKNWEPGTINDYMKAIDKWHITETSLKMVKVRLGLFSGQEYICHELVENYYTWKGEPKNRCYIEYKDELCNCMRRTQVGAYGIAQGYIKIDAIIEEIKKKGYVQIPFRAFYDMRQYKKNYDGCYIEIKKD